MDLLGSILNTMDGPPKIDDKQKEQIKKRKEEEEKLKTQNKKDFQKFRDFVEARIGRFVKDDRKFIPFQPMDKLYRSVVHDICETAGGLLAMSFGEEGLDRYIIVYKKEFPPSEDEIVARRSGDDWTEDVAKEYAKRREERKQVLRDGSTPSADSSVKPKSNYKDKYVHLIGEDAALEAAKKTESNKNYGFVPSANKRDIRSIEQTMADIQKKKRLKQEIDEKVDE